MTRYTGVYFSPDTMYIWALMYIVKPWSRVRARLVHLITARDPDRVATVLGPLGQTSIGRLQVRISAGATVPKFTQSSVPPGSVNEYQLRLGRQKQVWLIPIADERVGVQVKL